MKKFIFILLGGIIVFYICYSWYKESQVNTCTFDEHHESYEFEIKSEGNSVFEINPSKLKSTYTSKDSLLIDYAELIINNMYDTTYIYNHSKTQIKYCEKTKQYYVQINIGKQKIPFVKFKQVAQAETDYKSYEAIAAMHEDVFHDWSDCDMK